MKTILVTGANGFIGRNLCESLKSYEEFKVLQFTSTDSLEVLEDYLQKADFIFHTAGVNRPELEADFTKVNTDLTTHILDILGKLQSKASILLTSSTQAILDNPYGKSKLAAENAVKAWSRNNKNRIYIYRLPGVFGKWSKPNYNSVVATFCHNISHNIPISISNPSNEVTLVYIDDVVEQFISHIFEKKVIKQKGFYQINPQYNVTLKELSERILNISDIRTSLIVPDLQDRFTKSLYSTYVSFLDSDDFSYSLSKNSDNRGWLAEFIKSGQFGQIFISKTKPGISRGDHWHNSKIEKFLVIEGSAEILFRNKVNSQEIIRYNVKGDDLTVLDIPTGYVHAIRNTGKNDLITLFWANEILDKKYPDTFYEKVNIGDLDA